MAKTEKEVYINPIIEMSLSECLYDDREFERIGSNKKVLELTYRISRAKRWEELSLNDLMGLNTEWLNNSMEDTNNYLKDLKCVIADKRHRIGKEEV